MGRIHSKGILKTHLDHVGSTTSSFLQTLMGSDGPSLHAGWGVDPNYSRIVVYSWSLQWSNVSHLADRLRRWNKQRNPWMHPWRRWWTLSGYRSQGPNEKTRRQLWLILFKFGIILQLKINKCMKLYILMNLLSQFRKRRSSGKKGTNINMYWYQFTTGSPFFPGWWKTTDRHSTVFVNQQLMVFVIQQSVENSL